MPNIKQLSNDQRKSAICIYIFSNEYAKDFSRPLDFIPKGISGKFQSILAFWEEKTSFPVIFLLKNSKKINADH